MTIKENKSSFFKIMYSSLIILFISLFVISLLVVVLSLLNSISSSFTPSSNPDTLVLTSNKVETNYEWHIRNVNKVLFLNT